MALSRYVQRSLVVCAVLAVLVGVAQSTAAPRPPSPTPDRIVLTWKTDPRTSQAVTWRTDASVREPVVQVATATAGPKAPEDVRAVAATSQELALEGRTVAHYHTANIEGLEPGKRYMYRVGDGAVWSPWYSFRTASSQPERFTFLYFGDTQNGIRASASRVVRQALADAPHARFTLHAGDLINTANSDSDWEEWHDVYGWANASIPVIATPGNHEYAKGATDDAPRILTAHWRPQFGLPENGPAGVAPETAYYVDFQGVRIIALNSMDEPRAQAEWLRGVLANNPNRWTVVTFHHPIYSIARGRDNKELRELWRPVLLEGKVDLVLQGHDHIYGRGNPDAGPAGPGPVYLVSVTGTKQYEMTNRSWARRAGQDLQLYQVITVDGSRLRFEARTAEGDLYDAFELRKSAGGRVALREMAPRHRAEQLRPAAAGAK